MAPAVDPTYPLYPVASILAATMLLLVLFTSFIRQSWNHGIALLCFWLFLENLTSGINAVIWADNADIKLYVYCDVVSHMQLIASVVKSMATLILTRRLYLLTTPRSVELSGEIAKRRNTVIEWTLGLGIPVLVAGPFYYIVQQLRFEVSEGTGCEDSLDGSILSMLLIRSWNVIPPLISVTIYYPRVARCFYRQSRNTNRFLLRNSSVSRANYYRIFTLASIDLFLTLPIGIANVVLAVNTLLSQGSLPFYPGWSNDHTDWEPSSYSYGMLVASGVSAVAQQYFVQWTSPALAFAMFGLFGVTSEARASYWRAICIIGSWFGWKPTLRADEGCSTLADIESEGQPLDTLLDTQLRSEPSHIKTVTRTPEQSTEGADRLVVCEAETNSEVIITKEARQDIGKTVVEDHLESGSEEHNRADGVV